MYFCSSGLYLILCNLLLHRSVLFLQLYIHQLCAIKFYLLTYLLNYHTQTHVAFRHA